MLVKIASMSSSHSFYCSFWAFPEFQGLELEVGGSQERFAKIWGKNVDFQGVVNVNNLISSTWGREGGFYFLGKPCSFLTPKLFIVMVILHSYGVLTLRNPYLLSLHSSTPNFFLFSNIQLILFHKLCIVIIFTLKELIIEFL